MKTYKAPWSMSVVLLSGIALVISVGAAIGLLIADRQLVAWLPLALMVVGGLYSIRGYRVSGDAIFVERLLWTTRLPTRELKSVEVLPDAMRGSLRLFGNGGLFAFTGLYQNKTLGRYRAFVTDPHRTVVLRFPNRTVVLSPAEPDAFVSDVKAVEGETRIDRS